MDVQAHGAWTAYVDEADDDEDVGQVEAIAADARDSPNVALHEPDEDGLAVALVRPDGDCGDCSACTDATAAGYSLGDVLRFLDDLLECLLIGLGLGALWGAIKNRAVV